MKLPRRRHNTSTPLKRRSRLALGDLVREAAATIWRRPGRALLTAMGTVLGVGALVTTLGLSATASHQVSDRFDAIRATEVVVQDARETDTTAPFPADTDRRLARLNGVVNAGTITQFADLPITTKPSTDTSSPDGPELPMFAASPGAVRALRPTIGTGRLYDQGHEQRRDAVALLGRAAAQQLGISRIDNAPAVFIGDQAFAVIGIVDDVARRAEVLSAVVIPHRFAEGLTGGKPRKPEVEIDTMPGAAATIARQAPYALRPDDPTTRPGCKRSRRRTPTRSGTRSKATSTHCSLRSPAFHCSSARQASRTSHSSACSNASPK